MSLATLRMVRHKRLESCLSHTAIGSQGAGDAADADRTTHYEHASFLIIKYQLWLSELRT
jgi:hypothetical protein